MVRRKQKGGSAKNFKISQKLQKFVDSNVYIGALEIEKKLPSNILANFFINEYLQILSKLIDRGLKNKAITKKQIIQIFSLYRLKDLLLKQRGGACDDACENDEGCVAAGAGNNCPDCRAGTCQPAIPAGVGALVVHADNPLPVQVRRPGLMVPVVEKGSSVIEQRIDKLEEDIAKRIEQVTELGLESWNKEESRIYNNFIIKAVRENLGEVIPGIFGIGVGYGTWLATSLVASIQTVVHDAGVRTASALAGAIPMIFNFYGTDEMPCFWELTPEEQCVTPGMLYGCSESVKIMQCVPPEANTNFGEAIQITCALLAAFITWKIMRIATGRTAVQEMSTATAVLPGINIAETALRAMRTNPRLIELGKDIDQGIQAVEITGADGNKRKITYAHYIQDLLQNDGRLQALMSQRKGLQKMIERFVGLALREQELRVEGQQQLLLAGRGPGGKDEEDEEEEEGGRRRRGGARQGGGNLPYLKIVNPFTGRKVSVHGRIGRSVLKKYLKNYR
jgi:hypothetical protein